MSSLLIRRQRPAGELAQAGAGPVSGWRTARGSRRAGRTVHALLALGIDLGDVFQAIHDPDAPEAVGSLELQRRFETVVLGSHLVNSPDRDIRLAFLAVAARHLEPDGRLLVEHHPLDWAETAAPTPAVAGGSTPGMADVRRDPPWVSAVSVFDVGGRIIRQPFRARVLSDEELDAELWVCGLERERRLGPTWIAATKRSWIPAA